MNRIGDSGIAVLIFPSGWMTLSELYALKAARPKPDAEIAGTRPGF